MWTEMYSVSGGGLCLGRAFSDAGTAEKLGRNPGCAGLWLWLPGDELFLKRKKPEGQFMVPQRFWSISEHCQNLNIWTPSIDPEAKKPVMVWFHGGGFFGGCSTQLYSYEAGR